MKRKTVEQQPGETKKARAPAPTEPSRALYIGNLDSSTLYFDICKYANQFGAIELVKLFPEKHCAFLNFMDLETAKAMHAASQTNPLIVNQRPSTVGWAKSQPVASEVAEAVAGGATRNLFLAGIMANGVPLPEQVLLQHFGKFGDVENVVVKATKGIAFVNMTSVRAAMSAVAEAALSGHIDVNGQRVVCKYAKEVGVNSRDPRTRPGYGQVQQQVQQPGRPGVAMMSFPGAPVQGQSAGNSRAIFLGNLPETVTYADVCKIANAHGALEWTQINQEKHICFINFFDPSDALSLYQSCKTSPLTIGETQIKCGWAKSGPLRPDILEAMQQGATRNLYVGNVADSVTEEELKALFEPFCKGEFDKLHIIREKKIAFVNLTRINSAIRAKTHFQNANPPVQLAGADVKVNYAKEKVKAKRPQQVQYAPVPQQYVQQYAAAQQPQQYVQYGEESQQQQQQYQGYNPFT